LGPLGWTVQDRSIDDVARDVSRKGDVMQTFTIGIGRNWFLRLWGRNELVRRSDRLEAWALSVAVTLAVIVVPIAAAVGTAVHDTRLQMSTAQAHDRHVVSARVLADSRTIVHRDTASFSATAEWNAANGSHVASVSTPEKAAAGDHVDVWVDDHGDQVAAPTPASAAAEYAVGAAGLMWFVVVATLAGSWALIRRWLNRARFAEWDRALTDFLDGASGWSTSEQ
jgi:hypothetical protein